MNPNSSSKGSGIISQIIISLLFIYFILAGNGIIGLLSCRFQQLILHNEYVKHLILVITIYITVFILATYSNTSILNGKAQFMDIVGSNTSTSTSIPETFTTNKNDYKPSALRILWTYAFYTAIVYVIFLATTKCEIEYLLIFFVLILVHFVIILTELYDPNNESTQVAVPDTWVLYVAFFVLILGTGMYTFRQIEEHSGEWSTLKFIFGEPKCAIVR